MSSPESRSNSAFQQGDLRGRSPQVHGRVAGPPAVSVTRAFWAESAGNTPSIFLFPTLLFLNVFLLPSNPTSSGASELSPPTPTPGPRFTIPSPSHFQGAQVSSTEGKKNHYSFVLFSSFLPFSIQLENLFLIILLLDINARGSSSKGMYIWKGETTAPLSVNHPFFSQGPEWYHFFVYFSRTTIATYVSFTNCSQRCRLLCNAAGFFGSLPGLSGSSLTSPHPHPPLHHQAAFSEGVETQI